MSFMGFLWIFLRGFLRGFFVSCFFRWARVHLLPPLVSGSLDTSSPSKKAHFQPANVDIDEVERKMMADAPKPQEGNYKIEDVFDQSFKDLMKDGTSSLTSQSICAVCVSKIVIPPLPCLSRLANHPKTMSSTFSDHMPGRRLARFVATIELPHCGHTCTAARFWQTTKEALFVSIPITLFHEGFFF